MEAKKWDNKKSIISNYYTFNSLHCFVIGRKRTVNFLNQRQRRHLAAYYTIITWRSLKVTGNYVDLALWVAFWFVYFYTFINKIIISSTYCHDHFSFLQCTVKRLLDSVFVIYRIIKVSARVISLSLGLITPSSTLIVLDITKTSHNNCL